jgi:hypothetical protein
MGEASGIRCVAVSIEQRGRGRAVREREVSTSRPGPAGKMSFEPSVGAFQPLPGEAPIPAPSDFPDIFATSINELERSHGVEF